MNDQMYKQNRRVMSNEYGQSSINQKAEKNHKTSVVKRGRISSGSSDFWEHQSASSSGLLESEPFLKRFYRNVIQFFFSQVLDEKTFIKSLLNDCVQVGVGSLIVGYTIFGAFMFRTIETSGDSAHDHVGDINLAVEKAVSKLWVITNEYNLLNRR